ncbi:hypothetical protein DFJ74DRAFT_686305 [Hyaloraphidium curvatum]|nr:hypothetical protein DFJ74DRAFT_686305 [Hyaloraphidium curvatum]
METTEAPPPVAPLSFSPEEWLLLFPEPPPNDSPLAPLPTDPAADLREARLPTRAWLLAALPTALLKRIVQLQFFSGPVSHLLIVTLMLLCEIAFAISTGFAFRTAVPLFGTPQLAATTAVFVLVLLANIASSPALDSAIKRAIHPRHHSMAQLAIWSEIVREKPSLQSCFTTRTRAWTATYARAPLRPVREQFPRLRVPERCSRCSTTLSALPWSAACCRSGQASSEHSLPSRGPLRGALRWPPFALLS